MVRVIDIHDLAKIVGRIGQRNFFQELISELEKDYGRWQEFTKYPRHATHLDHGVIELMPICDESRYAYKYVNGHPNNPINGKQTVVAIGMLADVRSGYPLLVSEMTLLTAYRTAGVSALAAKYLARKNSKCMALVGTGAQGEFQSLAFDAVFDLNSIRYFDIDPAAMEKYAANLSGFEINLVRCESVEDAIEGADIITTATADKKRAVILKDSILRDGVHVNGIGGDCPGKTEMEQASVKRAKVVVEFLEQTKEEGEIQSLGSDAVYAELWEIISGNKKGRESESEITLFDSVGFAIEDYSVLNYIFRLATEFEIGSDIALIPEPDDPKNLFGIFKK